MELRKRIHEIEQHNELMGLSISRTKRDIKRLRLERSLLLEKLEERTVLKVDDSDGSPSPPSLQSDAAALKRPGSNAGSPRKRKPSEQDSGAHTHTPSKKHSSFARQGSGETADMEMNGFDEDEDAPASNTTARSKRSQPRDPSLPKRPQNAYIIFCDLEKERVKREVEEANSGHPFDLTKAMAEKWHELADPERQRFYQLYEDDKERYAREMSACDLPNLSPSELKEKQRAEKTVRDIEKLRREGKKPPVLSGSPLARVIEATSGPEAAEAAINGLAHDEAKSPVPEAS